MGEATRTQTGLHQNQLPMLILLFWILEMNASLTVQYNECLKITSKKWMKNNWILNGFARNWSLERFVLTKLYKKDSNFIYDFKYITPMALEWKKMFQKIKNHKRTLFIFFNMFLQINMFHFAITIYTGARIIGQNIKLKSPTAPTGAS